MTEATFIIVGAQKNLDAEVYNKLELAFVDDSEGPGFCNEIPDCTVRDWAIESLRDELGIFEIAEGLCSDPSFYTSQINLYARLEAYGDSV